LRVCVDLNVWCADFLARQAHRQNTAAQATIAAVRGVVPVRQPLQLVISWGMLDRLKMVVGREFGFSDDAAAALCDAIAGYAEAGPSLTLGGVGVIPIHDPEDRHVLETAWAGFADILVTADFRGFVSADAQVVVADRLGRLHRGDRRLTIVHPFFFAAWLRGELPSLPV
jgi:hypothetical protein